MQVLQRLGRDAAGADQSEDAFITQALDGVVEHLHLRELLVAVKVRDGEQLQLAGLQMRQRRLQHHERNLHASRQQFAIGARAARERHMHDVDAGALAQQLARDMPGRADAQ